MRGPGDGGHESGPGLFERWADDFGRNLGGSIVDFYDDFDSRGHAFRPFVVLGYKRNGWASARTDFGDKRAAYGSMEAQAHAVVSQGGRLLVIEMMRFDGVGGWKTQESAREWEWWFQGRQIEMEGTLTIASFQVQSGHFPSHPSTRGRCRQGRMVRTTSPAVGGTGRHRHTHVLSSGGRAGAVFHPSITARAVKHSTYPWFS
ncbi:uncharacterized protein CCOS01_12898 [Colletotrichum costaricense]|uniref:Uncharacterized protein n=1 Tax=Colletotrichum costaricense TaxID=1209916 RepID=A0AAJ0DVH1_9PEZI|nr:uncharacterized protein CCOS01_12898 [Colletotrichum costaricense]KAK1515700.1 hypothetical protein CCOS01_12898 [Colletotrichum costaricense]